MAETTMKSRIEGVRVSEVCPKCGECWILSLDGDDPPPDFIFACPCGTPLGMQKQPIHLGDPHDEHTSSQS